MNDDTGKTPGKTPDTVSDSLTAIPTPPVLPPQYTLADDDVPTDTPVPDAVLPPPGPAVPARERLGIRVRTVVFGLVILAISVTSLVSELAGIRVDGAAMALTLLLGAGAALVCGGLATALKETRRANQAVSRS